MNKTLLIIGVVFIALGVIAGTITVNQSQLYGLIETSTQPYSDYMIPLVVAGIALVLVGAFTGKTEQKKKKK